MLYSVRSLLKLPDLSDDVRNLNQKKFKNVINIYSFSLLVCSVSSCTHHPHLGEVNETLLCEIRCSLLNKGQICQIHSQIWNTRRVAAVRGGGDKFHE